MRTLIATEFVTLDGVMEAPGGEPTHPHAGWVGPHFDDAVGAYKLQETLDAESLLIGRKTYETFVGAWPQRDGPFADKMNAMPKHVASTTLRDPDWNATVLEGDVPTAVQALKATDGGPILLAGSCSLLHTLLLAELVDELRLMLFPVAIGHGLRVFPGDHQKLSFTLADQHRFPSGATLLTYHRA